MTVQELIEELQKVEDKTLPTNIESLEFKTFEDPESSNAMLFLLETYQPSDAKQTAFSGRWREGEKDGE